MSSSVVSDSSSGSSVWRIALFVCIIAAAVWLGGSLARALVGNDILKPGTVEFEEFIDPQAERQVFRSLSVISVAVMVSYCIALTSSVVFFVATPLRFKDHGWLMMSAILFYLFVPVELYTMYLDWKMVYLEFFTTADNEMFRTLFRARLLALQGVPFIAVLCYYTVIALAVFQPMKKAAAA